MIKIINNSRNVEHYFVIDLGISKDTYITQLNKTFDKYLEYKSNLNFKYTETYYLKFYLSDIVNQKSELDKFMRANYPDIYYVVIGQKPASGAKISVEGVFIESENLIALTRDKCSSTLDFKNYKMTIGDVDSSSIQCSYSETTEILNNLQSRLAVNNSTLEDNVIRTWFYIKDIDNNYQGMVDSRNEFFKQIGLTKDTHFITSTGIQGQNSQYNKYVAFNYLSMEGIGKDQIKYLNALEYLNPTHEYNVSFERGVRVDVFDQMRYYLSGTASIDSKGDVLHPGDVKKQLNRIFVNMKELLKDGDGTLDDMMMMVVYLRDIADYEVIENYLCNQDLIDCPYLILEGSVCRPEWVIEIEGIAIKQNSDILVNL